MWTRTVTESGEDVSSIRGTKPGSERSPKELKPEVRVFKTTVVMISAFCITLRKYTYRAYAHCLRAKHNARNRIPT